MLKSLQFCGSVKRINSLSNKCLPSIIKRCLSEDKSDNNSNNNKTTDEESVKETDVLEQLSFSKAFDKFKKMSIDSRKPPIVDNLSTETFPTLLRHSPLIQLGDPEGKVVIGRVVQIVEDDLYIDFGAKFNAVCRRPKRNQSDYVRGAKVKIRINDMELSERFLGSTKDMTLLEADATLLGIVWSPARNKTKDSQTSTNEVQEIDI